MAAGKDLFGVLLIMLCTAVFTVPGCGNDDSETIEHVPSIRIPGPSPTPVSTVVEEAFDKALWIDPPMENRPYVRWWWPGGDVEEEQLRSDLALLKQTGFGGVEVQPLLLGFTPEEIENHPDIRTVGTPEFFNEVRVAAEAARKHGLGFDVTLGSGWSTGVPDASDVAEKQLLMSSLEVTGPTQNQGPLPTPDPPAYRERVNAIMNVVGPFDENFKLVAVTAAKVIDGDAEIPVLGSFTDITEFGGKGNLDWEVPDGTWQIFAFYENNTSHAPVGAAYPGEWQDALIIDHFDPAAARKLIESYGNPLLEALGDYEPDAVFVDSFEMVGELPWTSSFLDRFEEKKGYDLAPYLPLLFRKNGESKYTRLTDLMSGLSPVPVYTSGDDVAIRVREDYEEIRGGLFLEGFLSPLIDWGHANGVGLRIQAHGGWADYLDAYQMADIPESEALFSSGTFDFLKLAASAAHISGNRFTGSESFITLANDPLALTLEDFYLLGGRALSAGINRIVYHGFPYTHVREDGEGWYPLSGDPGMLRAGPIPFTSWISENHPAWPSLLAFNEYLARLSYAMSCGSHKSDIAWLYPDREFPDNPMDRSGESETSLALRRAGFVYDRISRQNLTDATLEGDRFGVGEVLYGALLIGELEAAEPEMMVSIEKIADAGIPVIVTGELPHRAPGLAHHQQRDANTLGIADRLRSKVIFAEDESSVVIWMKESGLQPVLNPSDGSELAFALEHREVADGDILMLFNESNEHRTQNMDILLPASSVHILNPQTGTVVTEASPDRVGGLSIEVSIPARRAVILNVEE